MSKEIAVSLANQIIDFVDDIDRSLLKLIAPAAPEHVKTAEILDPDKREGLPNADFALVLRTKEAHTLKKFPIQDAAHTWLSARYFEKTSAALPFVAQKIAATNIRRACAIYNVESGEHINKLASSDVIGNVYNEATDWKRNREESMQSMSKIAEAAKPDGSNHFYALNGSYAMPTADYVKKAAAYFVDHEREFGDAEDRHNFASNVLARAAELKVQVECAPTLAKYASQSYGDRLGSQIHFRADALQHKTELSDALNKLASFKDSTDAPTFARALYLFDKKAGLEKYYGKGIITDAFQATFGRAESMDKEAGTTHWESRDGDLKLTDKDLQKLATDKYDKVKSYFGETLAGSLKKDPSIIFDSLPDDAQETLARIIHGEI